MKPLHTSEFRTTSDSNAKVDTVERYTFPDGQPYREIAVKVDAGMTPAEARRLIADLQHAIALAEEFDAPEREDVSTEDQPKPREWRDREGDLWRDVDADQVVLIECKGRLPETAVGPHSRAVVERSWGPLVEVLADSEDQPKPRVWQDSDGDRWDEQPDGSLKLRAKSPTMSDNLVLTRRQADEFYGPLSEVLADSEQVTHG